VLKINKGIFYKGLEKHST